MALHDRLPAVGHAQISDFTAGEEIKNPGSVAFCGAVAVSGDNGPNALKAKFFGRLQGTKPQFLVMDGPNSHVASVNCFVFSISLKN